MMGCTGFPIGNIGFVMGKIFVDGTFLVARL